MKNQNHYGWNSLTIYDWSLKTNIRYYLPYQLFHKNGWESLHADDEGKNNPKFLQITFEYFEFKVYCWNPDLTHFIPMFPFYTPWKHKIFWCFYTPWKHKIIWYFYTPWKHKIIRCFQGVQKRSIGLKTEDDEAENATFPAVTSINV